MQSRSDLTIGDGAAQEHATVTHEGRDFTAGGFAIDLDAGRMVGYVGLEGNRLVLQTWGGETLSPLWLTGRAAGFHGTSLYCYHTVKPVAGFYWHGRGLGAGMILKLRRGRRA